MILLVAVISLSLWDENGLLLEVGEDVAQQIPVRSFLDVFLAVSTNDFNSNEKKRFVLISSSAFCLGPLSLRFYFIHAFHPSKNDKDNDSVLCIIIYVVDFIGTYGYENDISFRI